MTDQEAAQADDEPETEAAAGADEEPGTDAEAGADVDSDGSGMADAVDDRAAELTGAQGAQEGDSPISEVNAGAVAAAEGHLGDTNLDDDRETLKKLQKGM
jgi:hypothetical protein